MKLVKSLQKTLNPFTKMVKKNNKLMLLLGVLLLLGLVLLVKMYMKKREGFNDNENENEIVLNNIGIESVREGWKMIHSDISKTGLKEARFKKGTPDPLTIKYNRSENTFTIHANYKKSATQEELVEWNLVWSNSWANDARSATGVNVKNAEFRSNEYNGIHQADKMRIFYTGKDTDDNPKYKIASDAGLFFGWWPTVPSSDDYKNAAFKKDFNGDEFYFIDTTDNNAKIDLFAKISPAIRAKINTSAPTPTQATTYTYTGDISQIDCIEKCLDADVETKACLEECGKWAIEKQKELETCTFNPGGVTPEDCKTRCEEYYKIVDPDNTTCINSCESKCNSCNSSKCTWLQYSNVKEFPYKLSIFGVATNNQITINWEKPPYDVKKYIIMYFEEEKQNVSGVSFVEVYGNECTDDKYCSYTIKGLTNNKNYVIGVSVIFQNDSISRTSERLVLRPEAVVRQLNQQPRDTLRPRSRVQNITPSRILTNALRAEQSRARTQKIIRDFRESEEDQISSLFSYLANNPINLEFKLS
jgi:hypothetical protein